MLAKPVGSESRHLLERACFFKKMRRARNEPQFLLAVKLGVGVLIQFDDPGVVSADDQERGRFDSAQIGRREIGPATARYHRANAIWCVGGSNYRGGGSGARSEITDARALR